MFLNGRLEIYISILWCPPLPFLLIHSIYRDYYLQFWNSIGWRLLSYPIKHWFLRGIKFNLSNGKSVNYFFNFLVIIIPLLTDERQQSKVGYWCRFTYSQVDWDRFTNFILTDLLSLIE